MDREALLRDLYDAHGRRDIDAALAVLSDDVHWPDVAHGTTIRGHDAVRAYWTHQFRQIDPHVTPTAIALDGDRAVVEVHQVVRDLEGSVLADHVVTHTFTFDGDRITAMEVS